MILSASGWRDVFSKDGNEESCCTEIDLPHKKFAATAAAVFAKYLQTQFKKNDDIFVIVGMDTRPTGSAIADMIIRSLCVNGCKVIFTGVIAAPEIMSFAKFNKTACGFIFISASHNPIGHNGIKFGLSSGGVLEGSEISVLIDNFTKLINDETCDLVLAAESVSNETMKNIYAKQIEIKQNALTLYSTFTDEVVFGTKNKTLKSQIKQNITQEHFGICADFNGCARTQSIDKEYFLNLGIKFKAINDRAGEIVHRIVPEGESLDPCCIYLDDLHKNDSGFVLGYVPDCDGDRGNLVIWDETAHKTRALEAQEVFALACLAELSYMFWLGETENIAVAINDPTSMRIDRIAKAFNAGIYRAEVGESNVVSLGRKLRSEGKKVRILGEGAAGGNITHPSSVRDPINTVMAIVKLLSIKSKKDKAGLFEIWCERSNQKEKYCANPSLSQIIATLPQFSTTGAYTDDAVLKITIQDHAQFKDAYQKIFLQEWENKKEYLFNNFGITCWEARSYNGITEECNIQNFSIAKKGGLKIYFKNKEQEEIAAIWMRGSATEPVFRIMADSGGVNSNAAERFLIKWQQEMVRKIPL
jgi:phosphoglucomutase